VNPIAAHQQVSLSSGNQGVRIALDELGPNATLCAGTETGKVVVGMDPLRAEPPDHRLVKHAE
jgi:hypothetical protein